jgi:hypothetical protein
MSELEFRKWAAFFKLYPFDDLHRYHRPAAAIGASFGGKYDKIIDHLAPEPLPEGVSEVDMSVYKAFGLRPPARKES